MLSLMAVVYGGCGSDAAAGDTGVGGTGNESGGTSTTGVGGATGLGGATTLGGAASVGGSATIVRGGSSATGGATSASIGGSASVAPTWSQLWTNYFQGACVSCHASTTTSGAGLVFSNATQLCTLLTTRRQLNGSKSPPFISSTQSVLNWFSAQGTMPVGSPTPPANAVNDIKAWATAGAVCP